MLVENIHTKKVVKFSGTTLKGRPFNAGKPNQKNETLTFYFSQANVKEARSVTRVILLFIKDHFSLKPPACQTL